MKIHPYANLFPMIPDEDVQALADDIGHHGLRQPVVIDSDGMILDGRNRAAACVIAQIQPEYETFHGDDSEKLAFVVSVNVHRRHLTTAQRAEIAAKIATMTVGSNQHGGKKEPGPNGPPSNKKEGPPNGGGSNPVSTKQAAKLMNVSPRSVERAKAAASDGQRKPPTTRKTSKDNRPKPEDTKPRTQDVSPVMSDEDETDPVDDWFSCRSLEDVVIRWFGDIEDPGQLALAAKHLRKLADSWDPPAASVSGSGKVPTVGQLVDAIPDGTPESLIDIVLMWANYKQSLSGKDKVRSLASWVTAVNRIAKSAADEGDGVVVDQIEKAIANGWRGWEHADKNGKSGNGHSQRKVNVTKKPTGESVFG